MERRNGGTVARQSVPSLSVEVGGGGGLEGRWAVERWSSRAVGGKAVDGEVTERWNVHSDGAMVGEVEWQSLRGRERAPEGWPFSGFRWQH